MNDMQQPARRETLAAWFTAALSTIGAADAGTLWWAHRQNISLPCTGNGHGCDLVAASRWAHLSFGPIHDFPLALVGLLAYLALLTLSLAILGSETAPARRTLRQVIWVVTMPGLCYSWYLQYVAHFRIGAFCVWCFSSACVMTLLFAAATWGLTLSHRPTQIDMDIRTTEAAPRKESVH